MARPGPPCRIDPLKGTDMENLAQDLTSETDNQHAFDAAARDAVYRAIFTRRDVRGQFLPDPVPDGVLADVLNAAHHAPSVGFMQPWDFVVVREAETKARVKGLFETAHAEAAEMFDEARRDTYASLKLEGIIEAPVNICVTCDRDRSGPVVIGRTHQPEMDLFSSVCAVQNLWLAARAEGLGVGWVSIVDADALKAELGVPEKLSVIAYLCVGWVSHFFDKPELETAGWRKRQPLPDLVHDGRWGAPCEASLAGLLTARQKAVAES